MKIDFQPIASINDAEEALAIIEIRTLFYGATYTADLEWDEDALLASFLEQLDDPDARDDYLAEPATGLQEARGRVLSDLQRLVEKRHVALADQSPFTWDFGGDVLLQLRDQAELTTVAIGYLWLSVFWLMQSDKGYLIIEKKDKDDFRRAFSKAFELICCFALTGRVDAAVWYLGDSRDSAELLRRVERLSLAVGSGKPMQIENLEKNQDGANDGGVDLVAIELQNGSVPRNALAFLVGATIQATDRRGKIMGIPEINRFTSFFAQKPYLAYKGLLAVPHPFNEADMLNCRDQDCLYVAKEDILTYLGRVREGRPVGHLRHPGIALLRATAKLIKELRLSDNDQGRSVPAVACALAGG